MADLILLNGPPGIGKSTLARMFADRHPGTLESLYDDLVRGLRKRPSASVIHSTHGAIEETYANLICALASERAKPRP